MTSLSKKARVAGLLYILASAVGYVRLIYIDNALIVSGNAAATANNIAAHEALFRWGIVSYLLASVLFLFVTFALYRLLEGVDRGLAILMVILGGLMVTPLSSTCITTLTLPTRSFGACGSFHSACSCTDRDSSLAFSASG